MNQKHVTSTELSKQLKEAGIPQESEWLWLRHKKLDKDFYLAPNDPEYDPDIGPSEDYEVISAFHVGELGEMLPSDIVSGRTPDSISKGWDNWECLDFIEFGAAAYHHDDKKIKKPKFIADTEAEARGKMLLYLKQNSLI